MIPGSQSQKDACHGCNNCLRRVFIIAQIFCVSIGQLLLDQLPHCILVTITVISDFMVASDRRGNVRHKRIVFGGRFARNAAACFAVIRQLKT